MLVQMNGLMKRGIHIKTFDKRLDTASMPKELVRLVVGRKKIYTEQRKAKG